MASTAGKATEKTRQARITSAWGRVRTWLATNLSAGSELLAPGATVKELARLEAAIGFSLPAEWAQLLRENNGQTAEDDAGLFGGWTFLSTKMIAQEWREWEAVRMKAPPTLLYSSSYSSEPEGAVEEVYTSAGWIPLAKEPMEGNYIGLDFSPGPRGRSGQVINFGRDEDCKFVLMPGLVELVEWLAECYEAGDFLAERVRGRTILGCRGRRLSGALIVARR